MFLECLAVKRLYCVLKMGFVGFQTVRKGSAGCDLQACEHSERSARLSYRGFGGSKVQRRCFQFSLRFWVSVYEWRPNKGLVWCSQGSGFRAYRV